jgi:hypothetical protein
MVKTLDGLYRETVDVYPDASVALLNIMNAIGDIMIDYIEKCDIGKIVENLGYIGSNYLAYLRTEHATLENISIVSYWVLDTYIPQIISSMVGECDCKRTCLEKYINEIMNSATKYLRTLRKRELTFAEVIEAQKTWSDEKRRLAAILVNECKCLPEKVEKKVKKVKKK